MPLFVAQHRHTPETCPAWGALGQQLLSYVSAANAARYGVTIQAEAVIEGDHGLILILCAADQARVEEFMAFFAVLGEVQVLPASSADDAVERGGCRAHLSVHPPLIKEHHVQEPA